MNTGTVRLAAVTNIRDTWRTSAVFSASGPTMNPGVSHSDSDRQVERVAQLHEARRLVAGVGVDRAAQVARVVGDQPERPALDAHQRGDDADAEVGPQFEHRALVGQRRRSPCARRRRAAGSRGSGGAACAGRRSASRRPGPGSSRGSRLRRRDRLAPRRRPGCRSRRWAPARRPGRPRSGLYTPRPPPSIIAGPRHADRWSSRVATITSQQPSSAALPGEAVAGHDADPRHQARSAARRSRRSWCRARRRR